MFFEVFSFSGLQVEPCVRKRSDVRQKCFDEGMKFILKKLEKGRCHRNHRQKASRNRASARDAEACRDGGNWEGAYYILLAVGLAPCADGLRPRHRRIPASPRADPNPLAPAPQKRHPTSDECPGGDGATMGRFPRAPNFFEKGGRMS